MVKLQDSTRAIMGFGFLKLLIDTSLKLKNVIVPEEKSNTSVEK